MRKILKLSITLVLAIAMLFAVAIIASAETEPTDSGDCGNTPGTVFWEYYADTKTLVISGNGSVKSFETAGKQPWVDYRKEAGGIKNLIIEPGIKNIGQWAFAALKDVETITLPDTVAFIGKNAFYNCVGLKTLNLGSGITEIQYRAFWRPDDAAPIDVVNVKSLKDWLEIKFAYAMSNPAAYAKDLYVAGEPLRDVIIPSDVTEIKKYAFYKVKSIESVVFHENVTTIGGYAFAAAGLKSATFDGCVVDIGVYAFRNLGRGVFTDLYINDLSAWVSSTFGNAQSNPMVRGSMTAHIGGLEVDNNKEKKLNLVIPDGVTSISRYAFYSRYSIGTVTLPESVSTIDSKAFAFSIRLKNINGVEGSAAESFAATNGYKFAAITPVPATGIEVDADDSTMEIGDTLTAIATISPAEGCLATVVWSSSDITVATVSNGTVTAVGAGTTTITATTSDGKFADSFVVTVPAIPVTSVSFDMTTATLAVGHRMFIDYTVSPANATVESVKWYTNNKAVATVNSTSGLVTAVAAGEATITISVDGIRTACVVTVIDPNAPADIKVTGVTLDATGATLEPAETLQLNATVAPADATNANVTWKSSNDAVATVVNGLVTAVADGNATITVTTVDGGFTATCAIVVETPTVKVTGVTLDTTSATLVPAETLQLNATVAPADATNANVTWKSSNDAVATVVDGLVTAVADGDATITVTTVDGEFTATCAIVVETPAPEDVPVEGISIDVEELDLVIGDTYKFTITYTPDNTTEVDVVWSSDNENVVTFNEEGEMIAVGVGNTWICVESAYNPDLYAECYVNVVAGRPVQTIALNKTTANLTVSDKLTLEVTFTPANATNKNIIWTTDNATVATVENGVVTAVGSGVANITATSEENPELSVTCKIIVEGTNETPALPW